MLAHGVTRSVLFATTSMCIQSEISRLMRPDPESTQSTRANAQATALAEIFRPLASNPVNKCAIRMERLALVLWLASALLPAVGTGDELRYGWQIALNFANPFLFFLSPLAFIAVWMNFVFLAQLSSLSAKDSSPTTRPKTSVIAIATLVAITGVIGSGPMLPLLIVQAAAWTWLASFMALLVAAVLYAN
ncbi:MAG: hypothetical protein CFE41_20920 [Burkholderiales bacterium PBB2]|nr:MAG: hypothetical protein CFE41_20920 [Burkholderiales bacterium PBB2]